MKFTLALPSLLIFISSLFSGSPTVSFSADEKYVTITNSSQRVDSSGKHTWQDVTRTIKRPLAVTYNFFPKVGSVARWVAPNGADTNVGTSEAPFKTISKGVGAALPGDVVFIRPGNYVEVVPNINKPTTDIDHPIIITCAPGALGKVTLSRPADDVKAFPWRSILTIDQVTKYIWVNGLTLVGAVGVPGAPTGAQDSANACGIFFPNIVGDMGCKATNCVTYGNTHCGFKGVGYVTLEGNISLNNGIGTRDHGCYFTQSYCKINGNIFMDNFGAGIHLYSGQGPPKSPDYAIVTCNLCVGNQDQIILAGCNGQVFNNTCLGGYAGLRLYQGGCHDTLASRNIFAFSSTFSVVRDNCGSNNSIDGNCCYGSQSGFNNFTPVGVLKVDPLLASDYTLQASTPCPKLGAYAE